MQKPEGFEKLPRRWRSYIEALQQRIMESERRTREVMNVIANPGDTFVEIDRTYRGPSAGARGPYALTKQAQVTFHLDREKWIALRIEERKEAIYLRVMSDGIDPLTIFPDSSNVVRLR